MRVIGAYSARSTAGIQVHSVMENCGHSIFLLSLLASVQGVISRYCKSGVAKSLSQNFTTGAEHGPSDFKECTDGFPKTLFFSENRSRTESVSEYGTQTTILIPDMNFTCSGIIKAVTVVTTGKDRSMAISSQGNKKNGNQNPKLQIWRRANAKNKGGLFYLKIELMLNMMICTENDIDKVWVSRNQTTRNASIFNCTPKAAAKKPEVSVQDGDILGIELPPMDTDADFEFYFTEHGPQNCIFSGSMWKINLKKNNCSGVSQQPQIQFDIKPGIIIARYLETSYYHNESLMADCD